MERFDLLINNFETLGKELKIVNNQFKKENKELFNAIVEHFTGFIAIVQDGKYVFVNSEGLNLMRCKGSAEIIGKSILETLHPDYQSLLIDRLAKAPGASNLTVHLKFVRSDGTVFDIESNPVPFVYNNKPAVLIIGRDITSELEHKLELRREEKLRTDILNAFKEVVAFYSPTHNVLWLNDAGKEQLGIKDESYVGKLCYKIWFNADKPCERCPIVSRKTECSERLVTINGDRIWMVRHTPLYNTDGILTGFIEYRADITEKKNTRNELERSHARQIRAEIANSFGHFENDLTTGHSIWSHGIFNILGLPYKENQQSSENNFLEYVHPDDLKQITHYFSLAYGGHKKFDHIYRIVGEDGIHKTVRSIGEVRTDPVSGNKKFFGVVQDITHMSNLEKQILDEREKYKLLAENAPFGLILTQNNKPVYINKTFMNWLGIESVSAFDKSDLIGLFHPNDRKLAEKLFEKLKDNNIPSPVVEKLRIINKEGNVLYFRFDLKNNTINNQKYVQTVIIDITADVIKDKKQKQVAADALYLNQKNYILSEIECVLTKILADRKSSISGTEFKKIFDIINSYKQLDKDWKILIANFEEVHPGFFTRLKKAHPLLSSNDIKHCACIKMNFDTKEIARFFNIKAPSVQIGRVRLKKKMNLTNSVDLRTYILNF